MAWEWLVAIDGILGLVVLAVAVRLAVLARQDLAALLFSITGFVAVFRIFYFVLPTLFGIRPTSGIAGVFPATEYILGLALVGAMIALRQDRFEPMGRKTAFAILYLVGLAGVLLFFQADTASGPLPYLAPLFVGGTFVAATGVAAVEWAHGGVQTPRRHLAFVLGPLFCWSLNDAIRIGHAAWTASNQTALTAFTGLVAASWLVALVGIAWLLVRTIRRDGIGERTRALLILLAGGIVLSLLQLLTSDPNGMRAVHLVLDCSAIVLIGFGIARNARDVGA